MLAGHNGWSNNVGPHVLKLLEKQKESFKARHKIKCRVVGLWSPSSPGLLWDAAGVASELCSAHLEDNTQFSEACNLSPPDLSLLELDRLARQPSPILIDCAACMDPAMEGIYSEALSRGISVVVCSAR